MVMDSYLNKANKAKKAPHWCVDHQRWETEPHEESKSLEKWVIVKGDNPKPPDVKVNLGERVGGPGDRVQFKDPAKPLNDAVEAAKKRKAQESPGIMGMLRRVFGRNKETSIEKVDEAEKRRTDPSWVPTSRPKRMTESTPEQLDTLTDVDIPRDAEGYQKPGTWAKPKRGNLEESLLKLMKGYFDDMKPEDIPDDMASFLRHGGRGKPKQPTPRTKHPEEVAADDADKYVRSIQPTQPKAPSETQEIFRQNRERGKELRGRAASDTIAQTHPRDLGPYRMKAIQNALLKLMKGDKQRFNAMAKDKVKEVKEDEEPYILVPDGDSKISPTKDSFENTLKKLMKYDSLEKDFSPLTPEERKQLIEDDKLAGNKEKYPQDPDTEGLPESGAAALIPDLHPSTTPKGRQRPGPKLVEESILKIMKYGSTIKPAEVGMTKRNSMQDIDKANGASGGQVSEATRLEEQGGGGESWYGPGMGTATSAATGAIDTALHGLTGGWSTPKERPGMTPEETATAAGEGAAKALAQNQQQSQAGTNGASPAGGDTVGESVIPSTFQLPSSNGDKTTQPSIPGVNGNKTDANISNPFSPPGGGAAGGANISTAFNPTSKLQNFTGQPTKKSLSKDGDHGSSYLRSLSKPTVGGAASGKLTDVGA